MIRVLLLALLFTLLARALWKLVESVIEGARGTTGGRRGQVRGVRLVRDPVCGTHVAPQAALSLTAGDATHYFCSEHCLTEYKKAHL